MFLISFNRNNLNLLTINLFQLNVFENQDIFKLVCNSNIINIKPYIQKVFVSALKVRLFELLMENFLDKMTHAFC